MSKALPAFAVVGAIALTAFLVWGLLGDEDGPGGVGDTEDKALREAEDEAAHLQGTGTAAGLPAARSVDFRITGRVVDSDRQPVAGCRIGLQRRERRSRDPRDPSTWALPLRGGWGTGTREDDERIDQPLAHGFAPTEEVTTDAAGRFDVAVDAEGRYTVRALPEAPRVGSSTTAHLSFQRTTAHVSLTVVEGAPLDGRVIDADERPVAAVVRGYVAGEGRTRWSADPVATNPADGGFRWPVLPAGKGTFYVTLPGRLVLRGRKVDLPHEGVWTIRLDGATGAVAGRIVDGEGEPVAGARLLVGTGESLALATSDADGAYRAEGLLPGRIQRVVVEAEGFGLQAFTPPLAPWAGAVVADGETTSIDVMLLAGATIHGVVREVGSGRPLARVEVFVLRRAANQAQHPVPNTKTDASGRYQIASVRPGLHVLAARSPTHHLPELEAPQPRSIMMTPQGVPVAPGPPGGLLVLVGRSDDTLTRDLELVRGLILAGRVVGPDGEGVAGAEVHTDRNALSQAAWRWGASWPGWGVPIATTDERGHFISQGLPPDPAFTVRAAKKPLTSGQALAVRLTREEPIEPVVIKLQPSVSVEGRVLGPDGEGVQSWVNAWSTSGGSGGYAYRGTEPDGSFRLEGLPAGGVRLTVSSEGYGSANLTLDPIPAGETKTGVEIRLRSGVRVTGTLVDQHGQPVANRGITLMRPTGGVQLDLRTDPNGYFETDHAPKGLLKATVSEMRGNVSVPVDIGKPFDSPAEELRLTMRVPERTIVEGTVMDPDGRPVPICRVTISRVVNGRTIHERNQGFSWVDANEDLELVVGGGPALAGVVVDEDGQPVPAAYVSLLPEGRARSFTTWSETGEGGRFRISGVKPGRYHIFVRRPGESEASEMVTVSAPSVNVRIQVTAARSVRGRLVGGKAGGRYQVQAWFEGIPDVRIGRRAEVKADGSFEIQGLGASSVLLVVQSGVYYALAGPIEPGATGVELRLEEGAAISGSIVSDGGELPDYVWITVRSDRWQTSVGTQDGRFEVKGLPPGRYRLVARTSDMRSAGPEVEAATGSTNVQLRLH